MGLLREINMSICHEFKDDDNNNKHKLQQEELQREHLQEREQEQGVAAINVIPEDVLRLILNFLGPIDTLCFERVCRRWKDFSMMHIDSNTMWKQFVSQDFQLSYSESCDNNNDNNNKISDDIDHDVDDSLTYPESNKNGKNDDNYVKNSPIHKNDGAHIIEEKLLWRDVYIYLYSRLRKIIILND